jgi:arsenate reductase-like glutaredoxin family protein
MTCRDARQVLVQAGVAPRERDMRAQPLDEAEIRALLRGQPASLLYSKRGRQNKVLGIDPDKLTDDEMIALMAKEPALIRRPTLIIDGAIVPQPNRERLETIVAELGLHPRDR